MKRVISYFAIIIFILFSGVFTKGLVPFPGDFMRAWYEPWKSENLINGVISVVHKPIGHDVFRQLYPFKVFSSEQIKAGIIPFWNPYNGAGMPLLAIQHFGLFNPFFVFFLIFPGTTAWTFLYISQFIVLIISMMLYCRSIGLSRLSSVLSSVIFIFSGFIIANSIFTVYLFALAGMPILLWCIELAVRERRIWFFVFPVTVAYVILSGFPQLTLYILIIAIAYAVLRFGLKKNFHRLMLLMWLLVLGIGLTAFQLLPTWELSRLANINAASSRFIFEQFRVPFTHLITLLIPNYFGNPATYNYWGKVDYIETAAGIGTVSCLLATLGLVRKSSKSNHNLHVFFGLLTLISLIFALDSPFARWFYSLSVPLISTGVPARIFVFAGFGIAILAGMGMNYIQKKGIPRKLLFFSLGIFSLIILVVISITLFLGRSGASCSNPVIINCWTIALRNSLFEGLLFALSAIALGMYAKKKESIYLILIIAFVSLGGLYNAQKFLPFSEKQNVMPSNPLTTELTKLTRDQRALGMGSAVIDSNFATYYKFYDPEYYDPLYLKRYGELVAYGNLGNIPEVLPRSDVEITHDATVSAQATDRRNRLLELLSVGYLVYKQKEIPAKDTDDIVWEYNGWYIKRFRGLPRAYIAYSYETVATDKAVLARLFNPAFDPFLSPVLYHQIPLNITGSEESITPVQIIKDNGNTLTLVVSAKQNGILVVTDNNDGNWEAYVDGVKTPVYTANYAFRSVPIPAGVHTVMFSYRALSFYKGLVISAIAMIGLVITIQRAGRRKKQ